MKPQIKIDNVVVTVWRHLSRQRATGYNVKYHCDQPGMRGGHFIPRRLGPSGVSLDVKSQQSGFELWTEAEKLEVWLAEPLGLEDIAVINTTAHCIITKAGATVAAEVKRKPLSETEYQTVQQERLIATMSQQREAQILDPSKNVLRINSKNEQVWRCESLTSFPPVTIRRVRYADLGTPDRNERTVHGRTSYYLEVFLTGRVLVCWTDAPVEASTVLGIDTVAQTILLTTGDSIHCRITDRKPTDKEQEFIQQERLIDSNYARPAKSGKPSPELDEMEHYEYILKVISNTAQGMERSPRAFAHMGEEDLRTQFVVQLNGHYEGQATGETFNYEGKTDILVRLKGRNIFIGECKIWTGAAGFSATINQLLGYTARCDTKTAIILFNRNKSTTAVLAQIPNLVKQHAHFKREITSFKHETGFRFALQHRDDKSHELTLTVLVFDVPS
ncbi:MAG: hypothetical protein IH623_12885 [Verrucomicrobia bacterium]|nr:hypothetical protein [Verrucomicrobiota bacterium]